MLPTPDCTRTRAARSAGAVTAPSVTATISSPSESRSSTMPMLKVCVKASPAAFAGNSTTPDVSARSAACAGAAPEPAALQATDTSASTDADSVTSKSAASPSATGSVGPLIDRPAASSSVSSISACVTAKPATLPPMKRVSARSTTASSTAVTLTTALAEAPSAAPDGKDRAFVPKT